MRCRCYLFFISIFLFFSGSKLFAQKQGQEKIDSLLIVLKKAKEDTAKVNLLNDLAFGYYTTSDFESYLKQSQIALQLSEKLNFKKGIATSYRNIGLYYYVSGNYSEALKITSDALKISKQTKDKSLIAANYVSFGMINSAMGNYSGSIRNYLDALKTYDEAGNKKRFAVVCNNVGLVYYQKDDFLKAMEYFEKALKLSKENKDPLLTAHAYNNIALVYTQQKKYGEALNNYTASLKIYEKYGSPLWVAGTYNNIGEVYTKQKKHSEALKNYTIASGIFKKTNSRNELGITYNNLGKEYYRLGNVLKSKESFRKSLLIGKETGNKEALKTSYEGLTTIDSLNGSYKSAFENYRMAMVYKDSLFNEENTKKITQTEMKYEFSKKEDSVRIANEKEIAIRDATLEANRREKWFFIAGLAALGIIGSMLYYQNLIRKNNNRKLILLNQNLDKTNRKLDEANDIKTRFFSILSHDLRQPVSQLLSFLSLQQENAELFSEEEKKNIEIQILSSSKNLLASMEDLLLWGKGQIQNFKPVYKDISAEELFDYIRKHFPDTEEVSLFFENPENIIVHTDSGYLKTIIRNLISNAVKAMSGKENGTILWKAYKENGKTYISVIDNGAGAEQEAFRALYDEKETVGIKTGLGLHLIRDLAAAIRCTVFVNTGKEKGTEVKLEFAELGGS